MQEIKKFILQYIENNKKKYINISKQIWQNPELGMEEFFASQLISDFLEEHEFVVERKVAGMPTAFIAKYGTEKPIIGFSAEYDALPGLSQKNISNKEPVNEGYPGHGCGHNLLGTSAVVAAIATKEAIDKFNIKASIKIFGTPAEELCLGKTIMAREGLFKGLDAVLDWHPKGYNSANPVSTPAYFNIKYHFTGRTGHGNAPWHGRSALDGVILQSHAVEILREHIKPGNSEWNAHTINYTISNTGPEFPNIVPDKSSSWYIGRFTKGEDIPDIIKRLDNCAEGAALATETKVEKEYISACHEMISNSTLSMVMYNNFLELGEPEFSEEEINFINRMQNEEGQESYEEKGIRKFEDDFFPVTDASEYSWFAPYAFATVRLGPGPGWHNWMVTACAGGSHGEKTMIKASELLSVTAIDIITNEKILIDAKKEHENKLKNREYINILPKNTPIPLNINKKSMEKYKRS